MDTLANGHIFMTIKRWKFDDSIKKLSSFNQYYPPSLPFSFSAGTSVEQVNATDFDTGINAKIRWVNMDKQFIRSNFVFFDAGADGDASEVWWD